MNDIFNLFFGVIKFSLIIERIENLYDYQFVVEP